MDEKKLFDIVESYRDDIINTLRRWINVPSLGTARTAENAPFGDEVRRMLDTALADAKAMGFETYDCDGYAMHAQMGGGERTMGILCHLDVVPVGEGWTKDPWGGEVEDGKIFGRGTADDKGCGVLSLYAMKAVREAGIPLKDGVRLILGCDEETGMTDMVHYASKIKMPDYGFSPDAEFPVINIEKGHLYIRLEGRAGDEPGDIAVQELNAGERANVVPGTAYALLKVKDGSAFEKKLSAIAAETGFDLKTEDTGESIKLIATGLGSHASMPQLGKNAAGMLLIALDRLEIGGQMGKMIKAVAEKIGIEYDGAKLGIACKDEQSGVLTCNIGILRGDESFISIVLDIRAPISADYSALCGSAVMALKGSGVGVSLMSASEPYVVSADHPVVKGLIDAYTEVTGQQGYAFAIGGGTYSRMMPNTVAFGPNFPGDTDMCHMPDEYMDIEKMMKAAKIYALAIAKLAGAEE